MPSPRRPCISRMWATPWVAQRSPGSSATAARAGFLRDGVVAAFLIGEAAAGEDGPVARNRRRPVRRDAIDGAQHLPHAPQPEGAEMMQPEGEDIVRMRGHDRFPRGERGIHLAIRPERQGRGMRAFASRSGMPRGGPRRLPARGAPWRRCRRAWRRYPAAPAPSASRGPAPSPPSAAAPHRHDTSGSPRPRGHRRRRPRPRRR
jgi:hypothetical protein